MSEALKNKIMYIISVISLIIIVYFPKINIISVSGTYVGIRIDDFLVAIFMLLFIIFNYKNLFSILKNERAKKIIGIFSIYILWCVISSLFGILNGFIEFKMAFLYTLRKVECFSFIFMGYYFVKNAKNKRVLSNIICFSIIFHTIFMLLNHYGVIGTFINGKYVRDVIHYRVQSTFNGAYEFSAFLTLIEPFFVYKILNEKDKKDIFVSIISLVCIALCIFFSESRTSLMIYGLILLVMPIYYLKNKIILFIKNNKAKSIVLSIIFIIFFSVGLYLIFNTNRFKSLNLSHMKNDLIDAWDKRDYNSYKDRNISFTIDGDRSFIIRISKWFDLIDLSMKYPITGAGVSISGEALDGNYTRILCESGIIGLILWTLFIVIILIENKHSKYKYKSIVIFGMFTLLLQALFIDIFEASKIMMFYYFILGCSIFNIEKNNKNNKKNSIVMATYNGEKYIAEQIDSILNNMSLNDELIISDDGSTDKTIEIIKKYQKKDNRIILVQGPKKGVKMNFQNAIMKATGDNIFLSDQDDVWFDNKVNKVSKYLNDYDVVTHNALIVDKNLKDNDEKYFEYRKSGKGILKNIYKNTYIGCCMAFKADLKDKILPIPNDIEMHDQWIGIIGEKYGESIFIDDCLIKYRRHDNNVSKMSHYPFKKMIKNRINFIKNYIKR